MIHTVTDYTIYIIGAPIILCLIILEIIISAKKGLKYYKYQDSLGSIGLIIGNVIINLMTKGVIIAFYLFLYQFRLFDFSIFGSIWIEIILTLFAIDFIYYWFLYCFYNCIIKTLYRWSVFQRFKVFLYIMFRYILKDYAI